MSVKDIETLVTELPPKELAEFTEWFDQFREEFWDRRIAKDYDAGRFDALIQRINADFEAGRCKPL